MKRRMKEEENAFRRERTRERASEIERVSIKDRG